jgi:hypothetical protein
MLWHDGDKYVRLGSQRGASVYMLEVRDSISVLVRLVFGTRLCQIASTEYRNFPFGQHCGLSPYAAADREVILWAEVESLDKLTVSDEASLPSDVKLEGHCSEDHASSYARCMCRDISNLVCRRVTSCNDAFVSARHVGLPDRTRAIDGSFQGYALIMLPSYS